jgi:hypothetical protein
MRSLCFSDGDDGDEVMLLAEVILLPIKPITKD